MKSAKRDKGWIKWALERPGPFFTKVVPNLAVLYCVQKPWRWKEGGCGEVLTCKKNRKNDAVNMKAVLGSN